MSENICYDFENFVESGEIEELEELLSFESLYYCHLISKIIHQLGANQEIQREQNQRNHYQINYKNILNDLQNFVNEIPNEVNAKKLKYITLFLKKRFNQTYIKIHELSDLNQAFIELLKQYQSDLQEDAEKQFKDKYYNFETVTIIIDVIVIMKNSFFFMELYEDFTSFEDQIISLENDWQHYFDNIYERKVKLKVYCLQIYQCTRALKKELESLKVKENKIQNKNQIVQFDRNIKLYKLFLSQFIRIKINQQKEYNTINGPSQKQQLLEMLSH